MNWLSEPWWAGVQGVASVIGVLAISIAVADFLIRMNHEAPRAMAFTVNREGEHPRDDDDSQFITVTVSARSMGAHVLYEPEWRVWGMGTYNLPEMPPILDVRSEKATLELYVQREDLAKVKVGVVWVVPLRFGPFAAGSRVSVGRNGVYERWEVYRWRYWPRKKTGRWIAGRDASKRNPINAPT
jgi:hypothetical protein